MQTQTTEKFDLWCIVELFGHSKIAGRCTEQNIAGTNMLRVDVPETDTQPAFTRFIGGTSIYAINPVDEETAKAFAQRLNAPAIQAWAADDAIRKHQLSLKAGVHQEDRWIENHPDDDDLMNEF